MLFRPGAFFINGSFVHCTLFCMPWCFAAPIWSHFMWSFRQHFQLLRVWLRGFLQHVLTLLSRRGREHSFIAVLFESSSSSSSLQQSVMLGHLMLRHARSHRVCRIHLQNGLFAFAESNLSGSTRSLVIRYHEHLQLRRDGGRVKGTR